jgi:hypothetical protein
MTTDQTNTIDVESAVLPDAPDAPKINLTMSADQILARIQAYRASADASLTKLEQNIETLNQKLNEHHRIKLLVLGQKELVEALFKEMTTVPEEVKGA